MNRFRKIFLDGVVCPFFVFFFLSSAEQLEVIREITFEMIPNFSLLLMETVFDEDRDKNGIVSCNQNEMI